MVSDVVLCVSDINRTTVEVLSNCLEPKMPEIPEWFTGVQEMPWLWAMFGSILVGLSGVLPLLVIPINQTDNLKQGEILSSAMAPWHYLTSRHCYLGEKNLWKSYKIEEDRNWFIVLHSANKLKSLLSFAVGGLLGDVFLHSLPEIWANDVSEFGGQRSSGLLILAGLLSFVAAEKFFTVIESNSKDQEEIKVVENNNIKGKPESNTRKHISGYLNLIANTIDNFTHGLSLGGAFLVSPTTGVLTTFAILVHEIPHEVGDFAILLKSGFTRWHAACFQLLTAGGGLVGALCAIVFSGATNSIEARTSWILPFTAGTFLHIALVTVLPDLLKEEDPKESFKQMLALIAGITLMAVVTNFLK